MFIDPTRNPMDEESAGSDFVEQSCCTCHELLVDGSNTSGIEVCLNKSMSDEVGARIVSEYYGKVYQRNILTLAS